MRYLSPREKTRRRFRRLRIAFILLGVFVLLTLLDYPLLYLFYHERLQYIENHDWYRLLRIMGYLGTWVVIAAVYFAHDRSRHRGLAIFLAAAFAGIWAELLKAIVARERPMDDNGIQAGWYNFRGLFSGFTDGQGLGFPSSHAAVAFGGTLMLACFLPHARRLLLLLAIGCGLTRMLSGAHFGSDIFVGALLGWLSARMMCHFAARHVDGLHPRFRTPD